MRSYPPAAMPPPRLFGESRPRGMRRPDRLTASRRIVPGGSGFRVGLCLPMRGAAGIWGPSCLASAQLAQSELNRSSGIAGQPCELRLIDASDESPDIEDTVTDLVEAGEVDALVGMCISSVRRRILGAVGGAVPFVYTCLYEGGDATPSLYAIGETSSLQLPPSIAWLGARRRGRRWMLVGNDYIWPWVTHRIARQSVVRTGGEIAAEMYLPFGIDDYSEVIDRIRSSRADAVLISMVGQDAVEFNRAFGRAGLPGKVLRLSCAIEENQLLAIGAENSENLHVALGYFSTLDTDANLSFKERYHSRFGDRAPTLNSIGQSLYEGLHFLAALLDDAGSRAADGQWSDRARRAMPTPAHASARAADGGRAGSGQIPIYLARAEGHAFRVLTRF